MVLLKSENIAMGTAAPDFELIGTDGVSYSLDNFAAAKVLVVIFMCNHCPYVQRIWPGPVKLARDFDGKGVQFVGINPNTANPEYDEETMGKMQKYFSAQAMNFPYLEDKDQSVAKAYGAICTPDIFAYDVQRKLAYHGRIDELKNAVETLLSGEALRNEQIPSQGCSIKWV